MVLPLALWLTMAAGTSAPQVEPALAAEAPPPLVLAKARRSGGGSAAPLKGQVAWLVAGGTGALIPLALFVLPTFWFALWGPFAPIGFVVAVFWAGVTTAAGGALAWLLQAALSDMRSGWLLPVTLSGAVGLGGTFLAGLVAAVLLWSGYGASVVLSGPRCNPWYYSSRNCYAGWGPLGPAVFWSAVAVAFAVWLGGALAASVAGPLLGAYLYRRLGIRNTDGRVHFDVMTTRE